MKKIQVSTVRQTADVEVMFVNASLISKVIKADIAIDNLIADATICRNIKPVLTNKLDEDGKPIVDPDTGNEIMQPVVDKNGKPIIDYTDFCVSPDQLRAIAENVAPLLRELVEAFEA